MSVLLVPLVVVAVAAILMIPVVVGRARGKNSVRPMVPMAMPVELQARVRLLLGENRSVQAVKEVRQATGLGLKEAKQLVDALRDGPLPEPGP